MKVTQLLSVAALIALLFEGNQAGAQGMAVNATGATANTSAMLDVSSTAQGVLVPRMTSAQRTIISSPATGLLVYQTDGTAGFYFYNGTAWTSLSSSGSGSGVTASTVAYGSGSGGTSSAVAAAGATGNVLTSTVDPTSLFLK